MLQLNQFLSLDTKQLSARDYSHFETDKKNLQKLLQKALEVELFTIPLYMSGMYSIEGYHQINTGNNFYQGRQWPGAAPKFREDIAHDSNQNAFNKVFKVFIEEMLHLQIVANLCNAYGDNYKVNAKFTDNGLLNSDYSWKCYGENNTVIPGIIDFKDLKVGSAFKNTIVKLDALNEKQIKLFLAIESSEHDLQNEIDEKNRKKYKHTIPFLENENLDEVMFGSISGLYISIIMYLLIEYKDASECKPKECYKYLYKLAFQNDSIQRDHFNKLEKNRKVSEYPNLRTNLKFTDNKEETVLTKDNLEFEMILRMIDGILDQGEGEPLYVLIYNIIKYFKEQNSSSKEPTIQNLLTIRFDGKNAVDKYYLEVKDEAIIKEIESIAQWLDIKLPKTVFTAVSPDNQTDDEALTINHPSYDDKGNKAPSASAAARGGENGKMDHHEIFEAVQKLIEDNKVTTWDITHSRWKSDKSKRHEVNGDLHKDCYLDKKSNYLFWCKDYLITNYKDYEENRTNYPQLPTADEIAVAMNEVTGNNEKYKKILSQSTTGTLKGLLQGMEKYWSDDDGQFPGPAMTGSGDRMSICWALLGQTPDLNIAPDIKITKKNGYSVEHLQDYHACQGLYMPKNSAKELKSHHPWINNGEFSCASPAVYHSCKGSNTCKSEGGCGYVQAFEGGGQCGGSNPSNSERGAGCNQVANGCGQPDIKWKTVPAFNSCAGKGGCAVPISALQMFPEPMEKTGELQKMKYHSYCENKDITVSFCKGELVYDKAWEVYSNEFQKKFNEVPAKPKANTLRLIFPPST